MRLKAILFDKDGTLVDFDKTWGPAAHRVMSRMAGDDRFALERLMAVSHFDETAMRFAQTSPLIAGSSGDYGPLWAEALGRPYSRAITDEMDRLFVEEGAAGLAPIGDPFAVLSRLKAQGATLGIVTNDSEAGAHAQCGRLGLSDLLDFVVGWDSGHGRKPAPGQIHAFLAGRAFAPQEVALVGDSLHDIHAAKAAGIIAIGVESGPVVPDGLHEQADVVLPSIMALEDWLTSPA